MKKYLIFAVWMLFFGVVFSGCTHDEVDMSTYVQQKMESYEQAFHDAFGDIAPDQDWGFGSVAKTRSTQKEKHRWAELGLSAPTPLTAEERDDVANYFATTQFSDEGLDLNWTAYYVEWVYNVSSTSAYRNEGENAGDMGNVSITFDKICVESTSQWADNGYEEIQDWNASNHPTYYMYETVGTGKFRVWVSYASKWNTKYTIQKYKGNYYVAFDVDVTKDSDGIIDLGQKTLGYYNDYIIRIIPGEGQSEDTDREVDVVERITTTGQYKEVKKGVYTQNELDVCKRIICEDLGQVKRADIDFNDVVFDVFTVSKYQYDVVEVYYDGVLSASESSITKSSSPVEHFTDIRLLAAGGTLPLTVAGKEVHEEFGVGTTTMVNTYSDESNISGAPHVEYNKSVTFRSDDVYDDAVDVPIYVRYSNNVLELGATVGDAPHKIAVEVGTPWAKERVSIEDAYATFTNWVNNNGSTPWNNPTEVNIYAWNETSIPYDMEQNWTTAMYVESQGYVGQSTRDVSHAVVYNAKPGSDETSVFTSSEGTKLIANTEGKVEISKDKFASIAAGSILRVYGAAYGSWNVNVLGFAHVTYKSDSEKFIEITLTADQANSLKTSGISITGSQFTVTDVTIDNSEVPSEDGETVVWSGSVSSGNWDANAIVEASEFQNMPNGSNNTLRIYATMNDDNANWKLYLGDSNLGILGVDDFQGDSGGNLWKSNNSSHYKSGGYFEFNLGNNAVKKLKEGGLKVASQYLTITKISYTQKK